MHLRKPGRNGDKVTCSSFPIRTSAFPAVEALVAALLQDPTPPGEGQASRPAPSSPSRVAWDLGLSYPTEIPSLLIRLR